MLSRREEQAKNECKKELYEHQGQKGGGGGAAPSAGSEILLQLVEETTAEPVFPSSHWGKAV